MSAVMCESCKQVLTEYDDDQLVVCPECGREVCDGKCYDGFRDLCYECAENEEEEEDEDA